jgi:hypothetical protein
MQASSRQQQGRSHHEPTIEEVHDDEQYVAHEPIVEEPDGASLDGPWLHRAPGGFAVEESPLACILLNNFIIRDIQKFCLSMRVRESPNFCFDAALNLLNKGRVVAPSPAT